MDIISIHAVKARDLPGFTAGSIIRTLVMLTLAFALGFSTLTDSQFGIYGDRPFHYHGVRAFLRCIADGEWLPHWAGIFDGGRGNLLFTFYPPIYYLVTGGLVILFGIHILTSMKIVLVLGFFLCQLTAYALARQFFNANLSLLTSIAYVLLPSYNLISLRCSFLPNAFALAFVPLALLGAHHLLMGTRKRLGISMFVIGATAVILTHVITAYLLTITIALMAAIYLCRTSWKGLLWLFQAGALVLLLTVFFWVPVFSEMPWVQIERELTNHDFRDYFLFAPPRDLTPYRQAFANLNYVASVITLFQSPLAIISSLGYLLFISGKRKTVGVSNIVLFCLVVTIAALMISLPFSTLVWESVPGMKFIQFPWRWQPFVALAAALSLAALLNCWAGFTFYQRLCLVGLLFWVIAGNLLVTVFMSLPRETRLASRSALQLLSNTGLPAINPEQFDVLRQKMDGSSVAYMANHRVLRPRGAETIYYPPTEKPGGISFLSGKGRIIDQELKNSHREFRLVNEEPSTLRIETYAYPKWVLRNRGKPAVSRIEAGSGLMLVDLPAGEHLLTLDFETKSQAEILAQIISVCAWGICIVWLLWSIFSEIITRGENRTRQIG